VGFAHFFFNIKMGRVRDRVFEIAASLVQEKGIELVDVEYKRSGSRCLLRVFIDKVGGVTIDDCQEVSRELSDLLDKEDLILHRFDLEVSSPGLTRPLRRREDFARYKGRLARVYTSEKIEGQTHFLGRINEVKEDSIDLLIDKAKFNIPLGKITKASLEYEPQAGGL
jgi:ribosome maturation factor RimP